MHATPDLRAVANVFSQTTDLRRACDGLVNLLGLQSEGAGAIAFRFVPVGTASGFEAESGAPHAAARPALSLVDDPFAAMKTAMPPAGTGRPGRSEAESFLDSLGGDGGTAPLYSGSAAPMLATPPQSSGAYSSPSGHGSPGYSTAAPAASSEAMASAQAGSPAPIASPHGVPVHPSHPGYGEGSSGAMHPAGAQASATHASSGYPSAQAPSGHPSAAHPSGVVPGGAPSGAVPLGAPSAPATAPNGSDVSQPGSSQPVSPNLAGGANGSLFATIEARRRRSSRRNLMIPILLVLVIAGLLALMAIPSGPDLPGSDAIRNLFGSGKTQTGELQIRPDPPARAVLLDGVAVADGTPAVLPAVEVGRHRIGLDLGLLGVWETDLEITEGTNTLAPKLTGSVKVAAADPSVPGQVWIDGGTKSPVPATLTDVPVGWVRIYYEDENLPIWERQVLVRADRTSPLVVPNDVADGEARIEVEALAFKAARGLEPSSGDSIWIDDHPAGVTPFEGSIEPGLHSVRVRSAGGETFTDMIDVHPGGGRHVLAQFGVSRRPTLHHTPPGRVALSGKLVLSVEVSGELDAYSARPALHFPSLGAPLREVPLTPVDAGENVFVGVVDADGMPRNRQLPYYFTILGPDGRPVYSDLYRVVLREPSASNARIVSSKDETNLAEVVPGRSGASGSRSAGSARSGVNEGAAAAKPIEPSDERILAPAPDLEPVPTIKLGPSDDFVSSSEGTASSEPAPSIRIEPSDEPAAARSDR